MSMNRTKIWVEKSKQKQQAINMPAICWKDPPGIRWPPSQSKGLRWYRNPTFRSSSARKDIPYSRQIGRQLLFARWYIHWPCGHLETTSRTLDIGYCWIPPSYLGKRSCSWWTFSTATCHFEPDIDPWRTIRPSPKRLYLDRQSWQ